MAEVAACCVEPQSRPQRAALPQVCTRVQAGRVMLQTFESLMA